MTDTVSGSFKKRIIVSSAPPAVKPVTGSWVSPKPKRTVPLDDLPAYYPSSLTAKTDFIICKAVKKFPDQTQVVELCKYVITELRPHFSEALRNKVLRQDEALIRMQELIHCLLIYNCDSDLRRYELGNEVKRSEEWLKLAEAIAGLGEDGAIQATSQEARAAAPALLPQDKRKAVMQALLAERGWSINDLASHAGIDFHTANRFVEGSGKCYSSTRKKLADAFGMSVDKLPA
jgi:lambda repressor-like predicted transcriptional regulator